MEFYSRISDRFFKNLPINQIIFGVLLISILWALIYLPNLRTNPKWYGDESMVLEEAWTMAQGHPRYGPMQMNFLNPNPHPPIYLLTLAVSMRCFGKDIFAGRILQVLIALATAFIIFWVGFQLGGVKFGFLCAAVLLTYPEAATHYRWVRGHPMQGMFVLASIGFLISFIQQHKTRDAVLAGVMCSLAMGAHYFSYPLIGVVILTVFIVNRRDVWVTAIASLAFPFLFLSWFLLFQSGGIYELINQIYYAGEQGFKSVNKNLFQEILRIYRLLIEFVFLTPTLHKNGTVGIDLWITCSFLGILMFPFKKFKLWFLFWSLSLMLGVFASRETVPLFLYQAFGFIPLLAIGLSGLLLVLGDRIKSYYRTEKQWPAFLPSFLVLVFMGFISISGSLGHFQTKIDRWMIQSWEDAESVMDFVNKYTDADDYVVMPDQLFWLYRWERKAQLIHCAAFNFGIQENVAKNFPYKDYWFNPSVENAKFVILAVGKSSNGKLGIDAIFWSGYEGVRKVVEKIQSEKWPITFESGEYVVLKNPKFGSEN